MSTRIVSLLLPLLLCGFQGSAFSQVNWLPDADGNWSVGSNWSGGIVPGIANDVIIDVGGANVRTVTVDGAIPAISTLACNESVMVLLGDLQIENGGSISETLTVGSDRSLIINGGVFSALGPTMLDGGSVMADGGSTTNFPNLAGYVAGGVSIREFSASNASVIDASNLASITGSLDFYHFLISAESGSTIDLSGLTTATGSVYFDASGNGSRIEFPNLVTWTPQTNHLTFGAAGLSVSDGGFIDASDLQEIDSQNYGTRIRIEGPTSTIDLSSLTVIKNVRLDLQNGGSHDFSSLTEIDGCSIFLDGIHQTLPLITSYDGNTTEGARFWDVSNGATLAFPNLVTANGSTPSNEQWKIQSSGESAGTVDLSGLETITSGFTTFECYGEGSLIDLSSLTSFQSDPPSFFESTIEVRDGGTVVLNTAGSADLDFHNVTFRISANANTDVSRLTTFTCGILNVSGHDVVLNVIDGTSSSFRAGFGGNLDASSLSGTLRNDVSFMALTASFGALLDLSNVTALHQTSTSGQIYVASEGESDIDLSSIAEITTENTIQPVLIIAADDATIDLSALSTFTDSFPTTSLNMLARDGGTLKLGDSRLIDLDVRLDGGTINAQRITQATAATEAGQYEPSFIGIGTVWGNLVVEAGFVDPGGSFFGGTIEIFGDYVQQDGGRLTLDLYNTTDFDDLFVSGQATLNGDLEVLLSNGFSLLGNLDFPVLPIGGTTRSGSFSNFSQGDVVLTDNGFELRIDYFGGDGNDIVLTTGSVTPTVAAAERKLLDGVEAMGGLADTNTSDDTYYSLDPSPTNNPAKQIVEMILLSQAPAAAPNTFAFVLEAAMIGGPAGEVIQTIELWNETASTWEVIDVRAAANSDFAVNFVPDGDLSRFVHPQTSEIIAKVKWTSPEFSGEPFMWSVDIDQLGWIID